MKIVLKEPDGRGFTLRFPSCMLFNGVSAMIMPLFTKKHGLVINPQQAYGLIRAVNYSRCKNHGWKFLEVESADGQRVEIII